MAQAALVEALVRVTAVFAVGLLLARLFRADCSARRLLWGLCFAAPILVLLPLAKIPVPILERTESSYALEPVVAELEPAFRDAEPIYLGDPDRNALALRFAGLAAAGLLLLGWRWIATLRMVRAAEQVTDEELISLVYELGQHHELADAPIVKASDAIDSPCICGILQPVILVPASLELSLEEWRMVLEHELVHLRRRDPLRLLAYSIVQHALWWNPLVWFGFRNALLAHEESVDKELAGRSGYARLLASGIEASPQPVLARLLGHGHLLTRIRKISRGSERSLGAWKYASLVVLLPTVPFQLVAPYDPDPARIGSDEVVFVSHDGEQTPMLWRMASDGRNPTRLPDFFAGTGVPRISPDGRWLAYNRSPNGHEDIYVARVDGTDERRLVATPARDVQPVWSPDGSKLVFCTLVTGNWELGLIDLGTGDWRLLTRDGHRNLEATWHPNGNRIVFSSHRTGSQKLWSVNVDGSDWVQLTFGQWEDTHGVYSADGRRLIYSSVRRAKYEATLLDLQTGRVQPLVPLHQLDTGEVEFTDGDNAVVMSSQDGTLSRIGRVDLSDMSFRVLTGGQHCMWPATRR